MRLYVCVCVSACVRERERENKYVEKILNSLSRVRYAIGPTFRTSLL